MANLWRRRWRRRQPWPWPLGRPTPLGVWPWPKIPKNRELELKRGRSRRRAPVRRDVCPNPPNPLVVFFSGSRQKVGRRGGLPRDSSFAVFRRIELSLTPLRQFSSPRVPGKCLRPRVVPLQLASSTVFSCHRRSVGVCCVHCANHLLAKAYSPFPFILPSGRGRPVFSRRLHSQSPSILLSSPLVICTLPFRSHRLPCIYNS